MATAAGALHSQQLYKAWGESRYTSGTLPTRYTYTGQYSYANDFGLVYYGSRFYDPYLNRWVQPDTIIPDYYNPLDFDRYSYVRNNPTYYSDPTGNKPCELVCPGDEINSDDLADSIRNDPEINRYWDGLAQEERDVLGNTGWDRGSFNDSMTTQTSSADFWHDPLFYLEAVTVGRGLVRAGMQMPEAIVLPQLQIFRSGGESWHLGLETKDHMNIVHVGNHTKFGIHIAFGAIKPYAANYHIYLMNTFPFIRTWRPK